MHIYNIQLFNQYTYIVHLYPLSRSPLSLSRSPLSQYCLLFIQVHMYNIQLSNHYKYTQFTSPTVCPSHQSPLSYEL